MDIRKKIGQYVSTWERRGYPSGIPDEAPVRLEELNKVGTYRLICVALMKMLLPGYSSRIDPRESAPQPAIRPRQFTYFQVAPKGCV